MGPCLVNIDACCPVLCPCLSTAMETHCQPDQGHTCSGPCVKWHASVSLTLSVCRPLTSCMKMAKSTRKMWLSWLSAIFVQANTGQPSGCCKTTACLQPQHCRHTSSASCLTLCWTRALCRSALHSCCLSYWQLACDWGHQMPNSNCRSWSLPVSRIKTCS